jgi:membrane peptidoglycan carboxypeptidase
MERQKVVFDTGAADLYAPEVLYHQQDFRVLLGMRYVTFLAARYGVQTDLLEVMSLPLGASEITLEEATRLYGGLASGQTWTFAGQGPAGPVDPVYTATMLISEIRDRNGTVLYRATPEATAVATPGVAQMTADILRNVILFGTGRSAKGAVQGAGGAVPIGGKTGTTNDFRNAAFIGYLPGQVGGGFSAANGWTVGVYVGYDDNRSMKVGRISVSGAVGALPPWTWAIRGIAPKSLATPDGGSAEASAWPLVHGSDVLYRTVSTVNGLPVVPGEAVADDEDPARILTRAARAVAEQRALTKSPTPPPARPPKGKRRSWWPF